MDVIRQGRLAVAPGDRVRQVGMYGLKEIPYPVVVQQVDDDGVVVGVDMESPPRTNIDGSVRRYPSRIFVKIIGVH